MAADWGGYNLPAIWQMLQKENVCTGADRVLAWDGLATSVREQHRRLIRAGDDLAAVWPPETNASALVFLNQIGDLAASMRETMTCAEDTRAGLRGVVEALGEAQSTVRTLAAGRAEVSDDWIPRFIDHAEDEYDQRAQQAMRAAEAAIADHSTNIKAPQLYFMYGDRGGGGTPFPNGDPGSAAVRATPVPVAVPHYPVLPEAGSDLGVGTSSEQTAASDSAPGIGPGLSGVTAPSAAPPALSPGPGVVPGQPAGPAPTIGVLPSAPIVGGPPGFVPGVGLGAPPGRPGASVGRRPVPTRGALSSGAVIGEGRLAVGSGRAGQAPAGGVGSRRDRRTGGSESWIGGRADQQWETIEGVVPVIVPDTAPVRHDPGPGVIGIDR